MKLLQSVWIAGGMFLAILGNNALATVTSWDPQGITGSNPGSGSWEAALWSASQTGQATPVNWIEGTSALFAVGSSSSAPAFTVTMNGTHTVAGIFDGSLTPGPCRVTISGTGSMVLPSAGVPSFNISNTASVTINVPISGSNDISESGGGILVLGGSNSFGLANSVVSNGWLVLANATGSATGTSAVLVNASGVLTGNGSTIGTITNFGAIYPTNLFGGTAALATGSETWKAGSVYQWAINNATGTAGAASGWDELVVMGGMTSLAVSSNPLVINIISLAAGSQLGALAAFDNTRDYSWLVLHSTNGPMAGFSQGSVVVNSSSFVNAAGPGAGFNVTTNNTPLGADLYVNFVHQPSITVANVTATEGSTAVFTAVNNFPGATPYSAIYSWRSNGVPLTDGGQISGSASASLTISNAQLNDAATYFVTASNLVGQAFVSATLSITEIPPVLTWSNPPSITYGTALTTNQLNATANVPGSFIYTPALGVAPTAGTNTLSLVFNPSNAVEYASATNTVTLVVLPEPLAVAANSFTRPYNTANPAFTGTITGLVNNDNITVNYNCSATISSPVGAYPIAPMLMDPGSRLTNYLVSISDGALDIGSVIAWTNPAVITYGTALSSTQLNATANVPGSLVYSPAAGSILTAGANNLSVVFTPLNNAQYGNATDTVSLVVAPAPLTVTASNASRLLGTTNPVFGGTIVGLENNDNITATYSTSANQASPMGAYPITPALVDPNSRQTNYSVNLVNGTLTVGAPPQGVAVAAPNIIPLPVTLQTRPGTFVLCPSEKTPAPAHALTKILFDSASQQTAQYLETALFKSTGCQFPLAASLATNAVKGAILITTSNAISSLGAEGYELTVAPDSVVIRAPGQSGTFYGVQSLLQLLPPQIYSPTIVTNTPWVAPCVYIEDYPRFPWRGVMLDVARHFFDKENVKQVLDAMAMHKLNTFHWHLVDDQGWRLEMTNYPNLTSIGAFRADTDYSLSERASPATIVPGQIYGGYYTQADAREIVAYAAQRHITVIPEIEMPCHSTAGLASYPQFGDTNNSPSLYDMDYPNIDYGVDLYSLGTPGTIPFLEDVITEVMGIFPSYYIHCGGDEVVQSGDTQWNHYTPDVTNMEANGITPNGNYCGDGAACLNCCSIVEYQHLLSTTLANFIQSKGRMMMGWTEIENDGVVTNAAVMDWESAASQAVPVAEAGLPVVMSPDADCYINYVEGTGSSALQYEPAFIVGSSPDYLSVAQVYAYNPIPANLPAQYTKNILGAQCNLWGEYVPSFRNVMFKMFPRETALAETTWTPLASQNYASFTNRLVVQKQRFAQMGVNYDHEIIPQIGAWGPTVPQSPATETLFYDITTNVTAAGEIDINFWYTSGADALLISSVALLVNNTQVDIDVHAGNSGAALDFTTYVLHLPELVPGATYSIQAVVSGRGGASSSGIVYMPNWN